VWTEELAVKIAAAQGVELTRLTGRSSLRARRLRGDQGRRPTSAASRRATSVATKDLYTLFPKAPARTVAKIAGDPQARRLHLSRETP
jgi:sulfur relay (sulfurtransferase) DsrC/TusE family protein